MLESSFREFRSWDMESEIFIMSESEYVSESERTSDKKIFGRQLNF